MEPSPEAARELSAGAAQRLHSELRQVVKDLGALSDRLRQYSLPLRGETEPPSTLAEVKARFESTSRILVVEPIEQYLRLRPIQRSLEALAEFRREAGASDSSLDARLQPVLADMALDLCEPWRILRSGGGPEDWQEWDERQASQRQEAAEIVEEYARWAGTAVASPRKEGPDQKWWRQQRAVISVFEMELAVRELGVLWLVETEHLVNSLRAERAGIEDVARQTIHWATSEGPMTEAPPMASPDERLNQWAQRIEEATTNRLPDATKLVEPGRRPKWRRVRPREAFLSSLALNGRRALEVLVEGYWERGASIARDVIRARELVEYWRESGDTELLLEARANAGAMLSARLAEATEGDRLDRRLLDSFLVWSEEGYAALEAGQVGWLALLKRDRGWRLLGAAVRT